MRPSTDSTQESAMIIGNGVLVKPPQAMDASLNDHSNVLRPNVFFDKLPLELREMIWTPLLVHPEPITAKLAQRIVLTTECEPDAVCTRKAECGRRHVRQTHALPGFPALAFVCKDLARETMIFYLKKNVFCFDVERGHFYQVNRWLEDYEKRYESIISSCYHETPFRAEDYLTLRLSFSFTASFGSTTKYWTVEYKLAGLPEQGFERAIDVKLGALLLDECKCWVQRAMSETNNDGTSQIVAFTKWLEHRVRSFWFRRLPGTVSRPCLKCGLPRYGADTQATDDGREGYQGDKQ
ncbi:hypothetical protein LTR27_006943 [Elasticomyces elasticus]|nr:hypothetical protein LTR27_006943 [Elasticomyces elasticus]